MSPRRAVAIASLALLSAACSPAEVTDRVRDLVQDRDTTQDTSADATPEPGPEAAPDAPVAPLQPDAPDVAPCEPDQQEEMTASVEGQLDALSRDDFDGAMEFSSEGYRAATPPETFEQMITEGFPELRRSERADVAGCLTDGRVATLQVRIADEIGVEVGIVYLMELGNDGWGIAGAVPADGGQGSSPVT